MNILVYFIVLLGSVILISADIPVEDCGSRHGSFSNVTLSCPGTEECILKRNTNVSLNIQFTPAENSKKVTAVVHGVIQGISVFFPIPNPDACSSVKCPLKKGENYSYSASFFVKKSYPKVKVGVKWELQDDNQEDIICVLIPAHIQ
ncbi:NPC intracellular cholesterol transporter 2 homolog a [Anabrus simplex]|uniref:NPC intracellular cholesterol transporter 2 homolog a n=1 Tax=Anabrus simplex TaxID=316456 RepID=UPI0034DCF14D